MFQANDGKETCVVLFVVCDIDARQWCIYTEAGPFQGVVINATAPHIFVSNLARSVSLH